MPVPDPVPTEPPAGARLRELGRSARWGTCSCWRLRRRSSPSNTPCVDTLGCVCPAAAAVPGASGTSAAGNTQLWTWVSSFRVHRLATWFRVFFSSTRMYLNGPKQKRRRCYGNRGRVRRPRVGGWWGVRKEQGPGSRLTSPCPCACPPSSPDAPFRTSASPSLSSADSSPSHEDGRGCGLPERSSQHSSARERALPRPNSEPLGLSSPLADVQSSAMLMGCHSSFYFTDWETLSHCSCTEKSFPCGDNRQNPGTSVVVFCVAQGSGGFSVAFTALCTLFVLQRPDRSTCWCSSTPSEGRGKANGSTRRKWPPYSCWPLSPPTPSVRRARGSGGALEEILS